MKKLVCENCGSINFHKEDGIYVCDFCGTKYYPTKDDNFVIDSSIALNEDVKNVLKRWEKDPDNGKKYAQMILQIDASNKKAREELAKYQNTSSGGCYIATCVYGSYDCPEVWTLRRYRDNDLANTWYGKAFIRIYYKISPKLVEAFGETKWFRDMWKPMLDKMVERLIANGYSTEPYQDRNW